MEESTRSRVLEPLDYNSTSLIFGSPSNTGNCTNANDSQSRLSYMKSANSPLFKSAENTPVKWQFERKEFQFESNSTPSKKSEQNQPKFLQVRKRRSQLMGAKPSVSSKLNLSTSKLDLIDESNFTSLPIPHPKNIEENIHIKRARLNPVNELRIHNNNVNRYVSYGLLADPEDSKYCREQNNKYRKEKEKDHPIVLVEDYISHEKDTEHSNKRRISLSDLKSKIDRISNTHVPLKLKKSKKSRSNNSISVLKSSTLSLTTHLIENSLDFSATNEGGSGDDNSPYEEDKSSNSLRYILSELMNTNVQVDKDKYLFDISTNYQLAKCVVCEKPLYEISMLVTEKDSFKEIVCGFCAVKYEAAAKIFEDYEFESSMETSNVSMMSGINSPAEHIGDQEWLTDAGSNAKKENIPSDSFSDGLIRRLHLQLQNEVDDVEVDNINSKKLSDSIAMMWFIDARKKIRWRWRVSGLLPQFLTKSQNHSADSYYD